MRDVRREEDENKVLELLRCLVMPPGDLLVSAVSGLAERDDPGPEFARRVREAAAAALHLRRISDERARTGFIPVPLDEYIKRLAMSAGAALSVVWRALRVDRPKDVVSLSAERLAWLGSSIGIPLREMVAHVRLGLLRGSIVFPEAWASAAREERRATGSALERCEAALQAELANADAATAKRYAAVEHDLTKAYTRLQECEPW